MTGQGNRVLISYNDVSKDPQNRDTAIELARDLSKNMSVVAKGYNEEVDPHTYDWLILIYSPEARKSLVSQTVENALDLTVKRHMRGVLAITPSPTELPPEWATIRRYGANTPPEVIKQAMSYAKTPYTREVMQELARTSSSALSKSPNRYLSTRSLLVASLATIMTILGVAAFFLVPLLHPTHPQQATVTISNSATATAQVFKSATVVAEASAQASATAAAPSIAQQQFDKITSTLPKFTGFQKDEKWDQNPSCKLDPQHATYEATIPTPGQYVRCMATATSLKNFAYQVTMNITSDAGGVIFRSESQTDVFYRFSVTPGSGEFAVIFCKSDCAANTIDGGTVITKGQVVVDPTKAVTLMVIAKDTIVNLYVNGKFVYQLTDKLDSPGEIGVYAASISPSNAPTSVTFTNPKVWPLDQQPQPQSTQVSLSEWTLLSSQACS